MAKQTELKRLLQELEIATRKHERTNNFSTTPDECARTFHAADIAEKRVFSFFDALNTELADSARAYKNLQEQRDTMKRAADQAQASLQELAKQVIAMKEPVPTATPQQFDEKRAAAGEPIEICMAPDHWIEKKFVGMIDTVARGRQVAYEHNDALDCAPISSARMASKTQQVQMFANVFRDALDGRMTGALFDTELDAENLAYNRIKHKLIASAFPVTVTVAK